MAQQKQIQLVSMRMRVKDPALLWLWCRSQPRLGSCVAVVEASGCSSDLTPSQGTSSAAGAATKKPKNDMIEILNSEGTKADKRIL